MFLTILIVIVGILFAIISFNVFEPTRVYNIASSSSSLNSSTNNGTLGSITGNVGVSKVTLSQLGQHNNEGDCWVGYESKAYDLTSWLPRHPGTAGAILPYCGTSEEFQNAFRQKHGTSKASLFMRVSIYKGDLA